MAKFKTHMSWGVFVGVGFVVTGLIYSVFSGVDEAIWMFSAVLIGSFLPDLDLDDGMPFQILFGLLGGGFSGLVFFNLFQAGERNFKMLLLIPVLVFIAVRFVAGYVFKKFTNHRGMFHSIPAAILFGLLTIWWAHFFSIIQGWELLVGASVTVGYIGHLVLDEIYSSINLSGYSLLPKQSIGSALKLYSNSRISTVIFYGLLFALALTLPETRGFF